MAIQSCEDLDVYQRSMALIGPVHTLVKRFPEYEDRDLVQQMRRASKSAPENIAEGFSKRRSVREFKSYLAHSLGSSNELLVHLRVGNELGYVTDDEYAALRQGYEIVSRQTEQADPDMEMRRASNFQPPISTIYRGERHDNDFHEQPIAPGYVRKRDGGAPGQGL